MGSENEIGNKRGEQHETLQRPTQGVDHASKSGQPAGGGAKESNPPLDFGVELCYVTISNGDLTPHQRWWYETADVHHRMKVRVQGWALQPSTIVCLTRGPKAKEWGDTVQRNITCLTNQNSA